MMMPFHYRIKVDFTPELTNKNFHSEKCMDCGYAIFNYKANGQWFFLVTDHKKDCMIRMRFE